MARLFVAVWPPPEVLEVLAALPRPDEDGVRYVPVDQLHVTLRFLRSADRDDVAAALAAARLPAATATLGPQVSRLGRSVVVVPAAGLDDLAAAVIDATAGLGDPPDPRGFTGHLTVARLRHRGACRIAGAPVRASFPVGEVTLVESTTRAEGPAYRTLVRYALT
jgi:2'-5' RNA ligase